MLRGGFHEEFPRVLPDMLSQEIEPGGVRGVLWVFRLGKAPDHVRGERVPQRFDILFQKPPVSFP